MSSLDQCNEVNSIDGYSKEQERNYFLEFQGLIDGLQNLTIELLSDVKLEPAEQRRVNRRYSGFDEKTLSLLPNDDRPIRVDDPRSEESALLGYAAKLYKSRRTADSCFDIPYFSGSAGFDILLDLYMAKRKGGQVSVSSACIGSGNPPTTALRWVNILLEKEIISKRPDPRDQRRAWLDLTSVGERKVTQVLSEFLVLEPN